MTRAGLFPLLALSLALSACGNAHAVRLHHLWTLNGLEDPESATLSADGQTFYVSNVAGEGDVADGQGFISRVSRDGKMLQKAWVSGLNAPKGGAVAAGRLYVADITDVVEIEVASGKIVTRHPAPGAKFLNDVAIAPDGSVLASDSNTARIYALKDGLMTVWAEAPLLKAVNGLSPEPGRLVIATMAGKLLAMDYGTRAITVLAQGIENGDGVVRLGDGAYLTSSWPGKLFEIDRQGQVSVLKDTHLLRTYANDLTRVGDILIVPHMKPGSLEALRITPAH